MSKKKNPDAPAVIENPPEVSTALSLRPMTELGPELVRISREQIERENGERVTAFIRGTMRHIVNLEETIAISNKHLEFQRRRLDAVQGGQFVINSMFCIVFNEKELNA